jgi:TM2 domain-containing membrane protein YozV
MKAASADPQNVFLAELLGTGIFCVPGIGHLMLGDVGMGLALLIGYPAVIATFWTLIITFTCGIGSLLVWVQIPINFLVGYLLGERVKRRVLEAKLRTGRA